jgi:hypothetical protein
MGKSARERLSRAGLVALIAICAMNIWTGGPMLALWVGSRVQGGGPPTMGAIALVAVLLAAICFVLVRILAMLQDKYNQVTGQKPTRTHSPWLRSMRAERREYPGEHATLTAPERVLVIVAILGVATFEVWFFFFSGSPIGQN